MLEGLIALLPMVVTFWIVYWLYSTLFTYVLEPLGMLVMWKGRRLELPDWFEYYVAPVFAILLAVLIVYVCGVMAHSWLMRFVQSVILRVPLVSSIYDAVRGVLAGLGKPTDKPKPQRVVLVPFPHPGMRLPAIVTSSCRDLTTEKSILCVYVPTTPIPTSGFFLMIPEDEVTELNWDVQQTLQAIVSGGLTAPHDISYHGGVPAVVPPASGS
ncbi:MAG: DUF502 domain-containing protein [Gemmataceae bacterium]